MVAKTICLLNPTFVFEPRWRESQTGSICHFPPFGCIDLLAPTSATRHVGTKCNTKCRSLSLTTPPCFPPLDWNIVGPWRPGCCFRAIHTLVASIWYHVLHLFATVSYAGPGCASRFNHQQTASGLFICALGIKGTQVSTNSHLA